LSTIAYNEDNIDIGTMDMSVKRPLPPQAQAWVDARRRHRLSRAQVQMARELGLNPKKLGKIDNHGQEPWKAPLPQFIEHLYAKRFGREAPEVVKPIEEHVRQAETKRARRKAARAATRQSPMSAR
jgi:hypothetical protein